MRDLSQRSGLLLPVRHIENAAPDMRLQPDNPYTAVARVLRKLLQLANRDAKLGVGSRRAHVVVVSSPIASIDADENLTLLEQLGP